MQEAIEEFLKKSRCQLYSTWKIGFASFPGADDVFIAPARAYLEPCLIDDFWSSPVILGDRYATR